ncbi:MAG: phosphoglycerate dehydrogenase [Bacteroidota bacterium]
MTSYPKNKIKILLLEGINDSAIEVLQEKGYAQITCMKGALNNEELYEAIKEVHIIGIRSKTQLDAIALTKAEKLMVIGCYCIGTNQVDLKEAQRKGIAVFNAPYSNTRSVAELVISNMIQLIRQIPEKNKQAHAGVWLKESKNCFELRGKVLGIIGYGHIGSQVSVLAESMGLDVIYYDVFTKLPLGNAKPVKSIEELIQLSDIITLHVPENNSTELLINADRISLMKPTAILINYARGSVVDLEALKIALSEKRILGAAIDVFPVEPKSKGDTFATPLQNIENVILTPHIGGSTEEAQTHIGADVSNKLISFMDTGNTMGSHSLPEINLPTQEGTKRILHIHQNIPGILSAINTSMAKNNINIVGQYLATNPEIGYVVLDIKSDLIETEKIQEELASIIGTIRTRVLF